MGSLYLYILTIILEGCDNGIWMKLALHRIQYQA